MLKIKQRNVLTRSSNQRQKTCKRGRKTRKLHLIDTSEEASSSLSHLDEGEWCQLSRELASKLSSSIISLASFDGETLHSECTGIVVRINQIGASFLTSSGLVTTSHTKGRLIPTLKIKVRLPNNEVVKGVLQHYNLPYKMVVVTTHPFPDLRVACLGDNMQVESLTELLAVRRCFNSGKLMATSGVLVDSPSGVDSEGIMLSTCKITVDGSGGPLVDFDGNIVGMNGYHDREREITPFVPRNRILECLRNLGIRFEMQKISTPYNCCVGGSSNRDSSSGGSKNKNQKPCAFSIHEPNDVWCELSEELASKLSPSIISLASFDGETLHSECTGIVIANQLSSASFLTSGSLFRSLKSERRGTLTIKVRLPNDKVVDGWLHCYMARSKIVVIKTKPFPDLCAARLSNNMQVDSLTELLAVRRCFNSGKLMATNGLLIDSPTGVHSEELKLSTCKITEAASGGPLVDFNGNIVGMNYYDREMAPFLPTNLIFERLGPSMLCNQDGCSTTERSTNEIQKSSTPCNYGPEEVPDQVHASPIPEPKVAELTDDELKRMLAPWPSDEFTQRVNDMLRESGYPLPSFADDGMHLEGDFEEEFGKDIWSESIRRVALKMSRSVVALASFNDKGERYFACTGVFIECNESTTRVLTSANLVRTSGDENKIDHNLRIEVCLPSKRHIMGTLQHYSLHYNVAVVSIMGFHSHRAAKLDEASGTEVVALGRGFESGKLMATNGVVTGEQSRLDCKELHMSTCKITKAGIGGPLVDFDGNFVGMNFYDMEETPHLPKNIILELMSRFDAERTVAVGITDESNNYRWPVPEPYWYYPHRHRGLYHKEEVILE